tara:strand:+ start:1232 stop:1360 length:129 start_codon:yes stop_codon:yes gene_type:complete
MNNINEITVNKTILNKQENIFASIKFDKKSLRKKFTGLKNVK